MPWCVLTTYANAAEYKKKTGGITFHLHGKKTDKETQSPVLKLFRDMVQKEKHDPEKTNLLNGKHVDKKRKHFLGYRAKADQKSLESSSSDIQRPYRPQDQELRSAEYHRSQSHSLPFQASNRSWAFWGEKSGSKNMKNNNDDTCSCVSCALKKLIGSDYACVGCLAFLFTVSVIIACILVYKCIPTVTTVSSKHDNERLKRKIDGIHGWAHFMPKTFGINKDKGRDSFQELGVVDADSELSKIIDDAKLNEIQSSVRLRDFYKKLLKADSNIRKLKKKAESTTFDTNIDFDFKSLPEREKRSISFLKKPFRLFRLKKHRANKTMVEKHKLKNVNSTLNATLRNKRFFNNSDDTLVFQKDEVLIQYKPRIVPKCSHNIDKDSKPHERLLKHPFYKNTQRLDELLEHFSKNLPDLINDQFGLHIGFDRDKSKCKHTKVPPENKNKMAGHDKNKKTEKPKVKTKEKVAETDKTDYDMFSIKMQNGIHNMEVAKTNGYVDFDGDVKRNDLSTNTYDLMLTISTVMNQDDTPTTPYPDDRIPNLRRLLQTNEEDDENVNYEDLKEVLADDNQAHDDGDKHNRKKRLDVYQDFNPYNPIPTKYHPPNVNNPNWKGPMPLYPDEINSMIKQGPVVNNPILVEIPGGNQVDELSDMDYIEDYLDGKYQGLVKLAQAYSDYGVFTAKKGVVTEKGANKMTENRHFATLTANERLQRRKKGSEGIRFEIHPTSAARDDNPLPIYNFLQKHIKVTKNLAPRPGYVYSTVTVPRINVRNKKKNHIKNYDLVKEKRSMTTTDGSNLYKVPFEYNNNLAMIDLNNGRFEIENESQNATVNNRINDLTKQVKTLKTLTEIVNLRDKIKIENDNDNSKVVFNKRSLKSFEEANDTQQYDDDLSPFDPKADLGKMKENIKKMELELNNNSNVTVNKNVSKRNVSLNGTHNPMNEMSEFFSMMSNLFSVMDVEHAANATTKTTVAEPQLNTTDVIYPMYDSDTADNINHRSRVLMSRVSMNKTRKIRGSDVGGNKLTINITNNTQPKTIKLFLNTTARKVKRHVDDNTIFWNDIYDDEYGVKMDVMENIKDKTSSTNEFIRRSNEWIQDKVKRLSDNFHRSTTEDGDDAKRVIRNIGNRHNNGHRRYYYANKNLKLNRKIRNSEETLGRRTDFSALTVHMKDVCRRAATAVKDNGETNDRDEKTDAATSGLMQQLVNLMTDLVDYQVQQRTCMKLPPDLYSFLEWLTDVTPKPVLDDEKTVNSLYHMKMPEEIREEKPPYSTSEIPTEVPTDMPSEREDQDPRSDCLGTLQAIQDLLRNFDEMPDDDKSKMTGVKEYLLSQITYLKKNLAVEPDNGLRLPDGTWFRYKRDHPKRRAHHKFLRNYSRRHTRTTASYYDGITFSEPFETLTGKKVKDKRNLRDIYYKALADAKKVTTVKQNHR